MSIIRYSKSVQNRLASEAPMVTAAAKGFNG